MVIDEILESLDDLTDEERADVLSELLSNDDTATKIKTLLGISGTDQDSLIEFVMTVVKQMILNYINQDTLPDALQYVYILMCVSYYKAAGLGNSQPAVGAVQSVKRGDVSTTFANTSGASGSAQTFNLGSNANDFFGWKNALNPYRKIRW